MGISFSRTRRDATERQVAITEADIDDIRTISVTAAHTIWSGIKVSVTLHKGGALITNDGGSIWGGRARRAIRKGLETLGYVLADGNAGPGTVIVTGRDPQHLDGEQTRTAGA